MKNLSESGFSGLEDFQDAKQRKSIKTTDQENDKNQINQWSKFIIPLHLTNPHLVMLIPLVTTCSLCNKVLGIGFPVFNVVDRAQVRNG